MGCVPVQLPRSIGQALLPNDHPSDACVRAIITDYLHASHVMQL